MFEFFVLVDFLLFGSELLSTVSFLWKYAEIGYLKVLFANLLAFSLTCIWVEPSFCFCMYY